MAYIDLHTHSTASDGTTPPQKLGALAAEAGLSAIALTDHDTTAGHAQCKTGCTKAGVEFVPGIEVSCDRGKPVGAMHILGYFVDGKTPALKDVIAELHEAREQRAPHVVEKLNALGCDISLEQIRNTAGCAMIGRPHIAAVLVEQGYAKSIKDAFNRYIGQGAPAYVRKDNMPTGRAIAAIHAAGGLAVLAHPVQLRCDDDEELAAVIGRLIDQGLDGMEVYHCDHDAALVEQYTQFAKRHDLLMTGGSDFHGTRKPIALGGQKVPAHLLDTLRDAVAARR